MKTWRFGILGSGFMGRTHAEAIRRTPRAELVAVALGRRAEGLAQRYGVDCEPDAAALVQRADLDVVVITTPHHLHTEEAEAAMLAGKHVLVEKPLTTTVADCARLARVATAQDRVLAVGYHQRFRRNNRAACDWLRSGRLGALQIAQISMPTFARNLQSGGFGGDWSWWNDPASRGHIFNSAPHAIDLLRWFTGDEVQTVSAFCRSFLPGLKVEDSTLATFALADGAMASLFSSRALPAPAFPGEDFRIRLMGEKGLLDLDPMGDVQVADDDGRRIISTQPPIGYEGADTAFGDVRMQAYGDQIAALMDAIEGRSSDIGRWPDGQAGVAVCEAILKSSADRCWIDLAADAS